MKKKKINNSIIDKNRLITGIKFDSVEEMCKYFNYKYKDIHFNRFLVDNGELYKWKIVIDPFKKKNKRTGRIEEFKYKLYHESSQFRKLNFLDYDGYHYQRAFKDLLYLGNYLKMHKS